jgi:hypothetical protein
MAKQPSLAAQAGALSTVEAFSLPGVFAAPQQAIVARKFSPYVVFAHPKRADEWAKISARLGNAEEGHMYFIDGDKVVALEKAKLGWIVGRQYWAEAAPNGDVITVAYEERPKPFKEHVQSVVLCYLDDKVVPCNMAWRSTKCPAAKILADALADCQTPAWADKSAAHKETLVVSQPFGRFFGVVELGPQRSAKSSGLNYRTTVCRIMPTGIAEWKLLEALSKNEKCQEMFTDAARLYESRLAEADKKVKR